MAVFHGPTIYILFSKAFPEKSNASNTNKWLPIYLTKLWFFYYNFFYYNSSKIWSKIPLSILRDFCMCTECMSHRYSVSVKKKCSLKFWKVTYWFSNSICVFKKLSYRFKSTIYLRSYLQVWLRYRIISCSSLFLICILFVTIIDIIF